MKEKTKRTKTNKPICSKNNKGITLIALILTIIVLLILAVVAISAVKGDGIISHAKNARDTYEQKSKEENAILQDYLEQINKEINGGSSSSGDNKEADGITVKGSLNAIISTTVNTPLTDDFGNKITVPAGFKIITKTDTENTDLNYTADDINVTKGIVVEDEEGNQFVWIPVGKIYTDAEKTEANAKTITLGRYVFKGDGTINTELSQSAPEGQLKISSSSSYYYTEGKKNATTRNAHAKDIEAFVSKTNASGGYYLGRYEARVENYDASQISTIDNDAESNMSTDWTGYVAESGKDLKLVSKANSQVWNYVTQKKASSLCQSMYTNKPYESDLVNSYAWDTAISFFQEFGENEGNNYANKKSVNSSLSNTGTSGTSYTGTKDTICNVYDMASNCLEWSTETYSNSYAPCTIRGGSYNYSGHYTISRGYYYTADARVRISFRPLLYM